MELNRLKRILRDRWIVVLVIALLGAIGAWAFTGLANQQQENRWQAEAAIAFQPIEGQTIDDLNDRVNDNLGFAQIAAKDLIENDPTSSITADLGGARLVFTAFGESGEEAGQKVAGMMNAFFSTDPLLAGQGIEERLATISTQAMDVEQQLDDLNAQLNPEHPPEVLAQIENLDLSISALKEALTQLTVNQAVAPEPERAAIAAQRNRVVTELADLQVQRAALPNLEPLTPNVEQQLQLQSLQNSLATLQGEYQTLYLRKLGITDNVATEATSLTNLTADAGNGATNAGIGFVGGLAVALFALIFINNTRKTIWLPEDISVPLLADVPGRRTVGGVGPAWYDNTGASPRKSAIQGLRSGVEARLAGTPGAIAIAGNHVPAATVHALVTDLAVSMASAGSSVLLVDADLESDAALAEYQVGGPSLSGILKLSPDSLLLEREVGAIIDSAYMIRSNLVVLPSGPPPATPADALAGRQFRTFIQEASKRFNYVVFAVGEARSTASQVAMQRIGRAFLVLTPGRSSDPEISALLGDITARQVTTHGAVFVQRSEGPVQSRDESTWVDNSIRRPEPEDAGSPLNRLSNYPFPVERHSGMLPTSSLRSLADRVGSGSGDEEQAAGGGEGLGHELLDALSDASAAEAYEAVADYLMTRVEDMMVAVPGQGDFSDALTGELHDTGFLPLRSIGHHRSVGTWLADELHREAANTMSEAIVAEMERILGFGVNADAISFDDWLASEFFPRHLRRTNGDPYVWALTSEQGTIQILAHATRFDKTSIEILISGVATPLIDRFERDLKASHSGGFAEQAQAIEAHLSDVRRFEVALGWLIGLQPEGSTDRKRQKGQASASWSPDWNLGFRENLAPIQRADLLPFPVLSDEEMDTFLAVG
jgi:hypothetical protein